MASKSNKSKKHAYKGTGYKSKNKPTGKKKKPSRKKTPKKRGY